MTFKHQCYTKAEAEAERMRLRAAVPPAPEILGLNRSGVLWSVAIVPAVCVLVWLVVEGFSTTGPVATHAALAGASTILAVVLGYFATRDMVAEDASRRELAGINRSLKELDTEELKALKTITARRDDIRDAVQAWLADGKTLRRRDLYAIRAYCQRVEPAEERREVLEQLAGLRA